jgi:SAM-dependent methyltransferase
LEIGPGSKRIPGFETLSIEPGEHVDYVLDCTKKLPFKDNCFDQIYASHVLEHVHWNLVENTLIEWVRILKPGGVLEIWVPDGLKICQAFVDAESFGKNYIDLDGWYRFNSEKDPCLWAGGRIFSYGDGTDNSKSPNWHKSIFSKRFLKLIMERTGLENIVDMKKSEIRGHDHGWINLGIKGIKQGSSNSLD